MAIIKWDGGWPEFEEKQAGLNKKKGKWKGKGVRPEGETGRM